jgi:bifunctional NMN adenylyltransferase/nudix hydrolase
MSTKYVKVMIGRFQPFHHGHLKCLRAAIDTADHVVVVIGSANNASRTLKNPWSFHERQAMVAGALTPAEREKVSIVSQRDLPGEDQEWVKQVKDKVSIEAEFALRRGEFHYTLVGCHKGADTYYLALYKDWNLDLMPVSEALNATDIRNIYFSRRQFTDYSGLIAEWGEHLPGSSYGYLSAFRNHDPEYQRLVKEHIEQQQKESNK